MIAYVFPLLSRSSCLYSSYRKINRISSLPEVTLYRLYIGNTPPPPALQPEILSAIQSSV
jgi:hypothetical protein